MSQFVDLRISQRIIERSPNLLIKIIFVREQSHRNNEIKKILLMHDVDNFFTTKGLKNKNNSLKETGLEPVIHRGLLFLPHLKEILASILIKYPQY